MKKYMLFSVVLYLFFVSIVFAQDMIIDGNGNVGIGTITPSSKIDVFTSSGDAIVGESSSGIGVYGISQSSYAGYFLGNARVTGDLTVDGLLTGSGIGDITSVNTGSGLTGGGLSGDLTLNVNFAGSGSADLVSRADHAHGAATDLDCTACVSAGELDFVPGTSSGNRYSLDAADGSPINAVYVDNNGDVGIGTTVPQGLVNTSGRLLHIKTSLTADTYTAAGIKLEVDSLVKGGLISSYKSTGEGGVFVGALSDHRLGFITNSLERMTVTNTGNVGIGTIDPLQKLHVSGNAFVSNKLGVGVGTLTNDLQVSGSNSLFSSSAGDFRLIVSKNLETDVASIVFQNNFTGHAELGLTGNDDFHIKVSGDGTIFSDAFVINHTSGYVGIGTAHPEAKLNVLTSDTITLWAENEGDVWPSIFAKKVGDGDAVYILKSSGAGNALLIQQFGTGPAMVVKNSTSDLMVIEESGRVGIGTSTPQGMLDVNGAIYQRGGVLHADYVFAPDYQLETIDEHAAFMWTNKHLNAIPKAETDEYGREIVEVGSHRKGIVEELEKAHIYIEELHKRIKAMEERLVKLER